MPIYRYCKKCKTPKPEAELGTNGVCVSCMEFVVTDAQEAPVREETMEETKDKTLLTRGDEIKEFGSHTEAAEFLNVTRQKVLGAIRSGKEIDGWSIA